ncbi:MAG: TAXI family TRAP transporter solute-binding subunit [Victivallales bacterium]|nr:TAXI family TRAP transporter solute-binding subunit [Victivallales bacterium]
MNRLACLAVASVLLLVGCSRKEGKDKTTFANVGTGGVTGVYYQVGQAIMKVMNERTGDTGVKITAEATGGSVVNINAILSGDMDVGICQSDRQYQAYNGLGEWKAKGPQKALRSICSFHFEAITFVVTEASGIRTLADVKGKIINVGNPGSGQRQNAIDIFRFVGIDPEKDFKAEGLKASEAPKVLQDGQIDGFFYTVGHPAAAIMEAVSGHRAVRFVPITGMEAFIEKRPYYASTKIPMKVYFKDGNKEDVTTIGMLATLVTNEKADEKMVYDLTKGIFENLERIRELHEAFRGLDAKAMANQGNTIPRHPGAERYFREAGFLK